MALSWGPGRGAGWCSSFFSWKLFRPAAPLPLGTSPFFFSLIQGLWLEPPPTVLVGSEHSVGLHLGSCPPPFSPPTPWALAPSSQAREGAERAGGTEQTGRPWAQAADGRDGRADVDAPRKPWAMGQGWGEGCQGFLRFALLGQKCLKRWGTCHPILTLGLP